MHRWVYTLMGGCCAGVYAVLGLSAGLSTLALVGLVGILACVVAPRPLGLIVCLGCAAFLLGGARAQLAVIGFESGYLVHNASQVRMVGTVVREPERTERGLYLTVALDDTSTRVRAQASEGSFRYGDRVTLSGTLELPEPFETDTGRMFDYRGYLRKDGVHYLVYRATVEHVDERGGSALIRTLYNVKAAFLESIGRNIPEPQASLVGGLIVGAKESMGEVWLERFRAAGLSHIVVLSGFNLTIIAVAIGAVLRRAPRRLALLASGVALVLFVLMVGLSAAVVRALLMALIGLLAVYTDRPYALLRALAAAGVLMVLVNPFVVADDPGFQLSFLATAGLVLMGKRFERRLSFLPETLGIRTIVAATLSTYLAVLPFIAYSMGSVSLVALPANLLVLPVVPATMLVGFVAGVCGLVSSLLAYPFALVTYYLTAYVFAVVRFTAELPGAALTVPPLPEVLVWAAYLGAVLFFMRTYRSEEPPSQS